MGTIFLSASMPRVDSGEYYKTADPFLIQFAVRELIIMAIRNWKIVWGGHPAITPMIEVICQDLNVDYQKAVTLYQSRFFADRFPNENDSFDNIVLIDEVPGDKEQSLLKMREAMLSRPDLEIGVFIGGMEGVEIEYEMFTRFHPEAQVIIVPSTGGAARELAKRVYGDRANLNNVNFVKMFESGIALSSKNRETGTEPIPNHRQRIKKILINKEIFINNEKREIAELLQRRRKVDVDPSDLNLINNRSDT